MTAIHGDVDLDTEDLMYGDNGDLYRAHAAALTVITTATRHRVEVTTIEIEARRVLAITLYASDAQALAEAMAAEPVGRRAWTGACHGVTVRIQAALTGERPPVEPSLWGAPAPSPDPLWAGQVMSR
jgi:hypothetical protein